MEKIYEKVTKTLIVVFIVILIDFQLYFEGILEGATFDPLEKTRVNRGSRHFWHMLKLNEKALENLAKIGTKSKKKSMKKCIVFLIDFLLGFEWILGSFWEAKCEQNWLKNQLEKKMILLISLGRAPSRQKRSRPS